MPKKAAEQDHLDLRSPTMSEILAAEDEERHRLWVRAVDAALVCAREVLDRGSTVIGDGKRVMAWPGDEPVTWDACGAVRIATQKLQELCEWDPLLVRRRDVYDEVLYRLLVASSAVGQSAFTTGGRPIRERQHITYIQVTQHWTAVTRVFEGATKEWREAHPEVARTLETEADGLVERFFGPRPERNRQKERTG